jgi:hypothetical protein
MRVISGLLIASVSVTGCATNSYKIPGSEIRRLATIPAEARGQHVRVVQELGEEDTGPAQPVNGETQIVFMPNIYVDDGYHRRDHGVYSGGGGSWNGGNWGGGGGGGGRAGGGGGGGKLGSTSGKGGVHVGSLGGGGGGDGKAEAVAILVAAAVILVAAAAVEGSRFDGYAQLHPMHPVHLVGNDGSQVTVPLAWIDPATAAFTDHAIVKSNEGPWRQLERAPLSRQGLTYAMFGGEGTYQSADGSKKPGVATTIQFGYFPDQRIGFVGSVFFGWRENAAYETLFESRYTAELQAYPVQAGIVHLGFYGGGGAAYRVEDGFENGNSGSSALLGGGLMQLDVNTRIALTARLGMTRAHDERMTDAMIGLSVY